MDCNQHASFETIWARRRHHMPGQRLDGWRMNGYVFWLVQRGEIHLRLDDVELQVPSGTALVYGPDHLVTLHTPYGADWLSIGFHQLGPAAFTLFRQCRSPYAWKPDARPWLRLEQLALLLIEETAQEGEDTPGICDGLERSLIGLLRRELSPAFGQLTTSASMPAWLARALREISLHPEVSVSSLAHVAGLSPAYFRRRFTEAMGMPPHAYLQRHQLELAQTLLTETELRVSEIARQVGFDSVPHFTRLFSRVTGLCPTAYRRQEPRQSEI